jgi:cytidine deaminase
MNAAYEQLINAAADARGDAYAPYSGFRVGAALLTAGGTVHTGCNVENASLGLAICAERVAVCSAVAAGERNFTAIAICADAAEPTLPCGACRQFLREFGGELTVVVAGRGGTAGPIATYRLAELLPHPFVDFRPPDTGGER